MRVSCGMRIPRALFRMFAFFAICMATSAWVLAGVATLSILRRPRAQKRQWVQGVLTRFFSRLHRVMGMRIRWDGDLPEKPCVLMGNHRSYVDAILFPVEFPVVYVARVETKSWPIIGWGATLIGTIWVDRNNKSSRKQTRETVRQRLADGMGLVIFPEGTTHKGPELLDYRPGMFYTCAEEGFAITPVAIEYANPNIAWVGNDLFIPHAFEHFGAKHIDIAVRFGPRMVSRDAESLRKQVRDWTEANCLELRAQFDNEGRQF